MKLQNLKKLVFYSMDLERIFLMKRKIEKFERNNGFEFSANLIYLFYFIGSFFVFNFRSLAAVK